MGIQYFIGKQEVADRLIRVIKKIDREKVFKKLLTTDIYSLINGTETRLYLETNEYLCNAYVMELGKGTETLYYFIRPE